MKPMVLIAAIYLVGLVILGWYGNWQMRSRKVGDARSFALEYFLGSRSYGWFIICLTTVATMYSAGTFLGAPGLAYGFGYVWCLAVGFQHLAVPVLFLVAGIKFAIVARKNNLVSFLDFFRERYESNWVVYVGGLGVVLFLTVYLSPQNVGGARLFESLTGVPYTTGLLIFWFVTSAYTVAGGFRAEVLTDVLQGLIMVVGAIALWLAFLSTQNIASIHQAIAAVKPGNLHLGPDALGIAVTGLFTFGISSLGQPHSVVRAMAYRRSKDLYIASFLSVLLVTVFSSTFMLLGAMSRGVFPNLPVADRAIPELILHLVGPWLGGLILIAPVAAIMSTVDSMLLVISSVVAKDIYLHHVNPQATVKQMSRVSMLSTAVISIIVLLISLKPPKFLEFLVIYALGGLACTFWGPFVFGLHWRRGNKYGAMAAMLCGIPVYILMDRLIKTGILKTAGFGSVVLAFPLVILLYVVVSLLTPPPPENVLRKFWGK